MMFRLQFSVRDKSHTPQHSRTYLKAVFCSCDRFTLWQMQKSNRTFVSHCCYALEGQTTMLLSLKHVWICIPQCIFFRSENFKCLLKVSLKL